MNTDLFMNLLASALTFLTAYLFLKVVYRPKWETCGVWNLQFALAVTATLLLGWGTYAVLNWVLLTNFLTSLGGNKSSISWSIIFTYSCLYCWSTGGVVAKTFPYTVGPWLKRHGVEDPLWPMLAVSTVLGSINVAVFVLVLEPAVSGLLG